MKNSKALSGISNLLVLSWLSLVVITLVAFLPVDAKAAWAKKIIDGGVFYDASMAINAKGKIHIAETHSGHLFYINNATGKWVKKILESTGKVGEYAAIAIDKKDRIHISYYDYANGNLKYATNASGTWVKTAVGTAGRLEEYTSIAVDGAGKVHISYYDWTNGNLKYATGP
jgi:hypothetical protein